MNSRQHYFNQALSFCLENEGSLYNFEKYRDTCNLKLKTSKGEEIKKIETSLQFVNALMFILNFENSRQYSLKYDAFSKFVDKHWEYYFGTDEERVKEGYNVEIKTQEKVENDTLNPLNCIEKIVVTYEDGTKEIVYSDNSIDNG